ncbi:MAG: choice-of-anchor R domain-containing protein [Patescibacteria group bacterium]
MKINTNFPRTNSGAAMMIVVLFFVFISLTILVGIIAPSVREFKIAGTTFNSKNAYFLAESGVEDALYRIRNNKQISASEIIVLGTSSTTTTITDISSSQKQIVSLGDKSSNERKVDVTVTTGVGVSFSYGVQAGKGGYSMGNNSSVIGSVYSNGPITGSGSITGSATSANSGTLTPDQSNGSGTPAYDVSFGNANGTQDFAQSFQVSTDEVANKVQLYIKKVGSPSNLTVRVVNNSSGSPSTTVKTSGTLSASLVSTNYGWVDVVFSTNPQLDAGTTYWIVLDAATSTSNYYKIGANDNGYANGASKIGQYSGTWNNNSPSTLDGFFSLYIGGITGLISGITIGTGSVGNAYSHTTNNSTIRGTNYCQTGTGNNKACNTTLADPVEVTMPISDQNIQDWKDAAVAGGTYTGTYTVSGSTATLGPKKITGDLVVDNNGTLIVSGTLWVQGNLDVNNNGLVKLVSGYGSSEGVIIVDGTVDASNNANFQGSGTSGSYMMVLSTSTSASAIKVGNNVGAVILYAANGTIDINNNGAAKSLNGYLIKLGNNVTITYDSGLANANFSSGPSGSYNISSWKETQ